MYCRMKRPSEEGNVKKGKRKKRGEKGKNEWEGGEGCCLAEGNDEVKKEKI